MKLPNWSYSTLSSLLDGCAWQVYLERFVGLSGEDHPRAASGTAYHAAIEAHEGSRWLWHYSGGQAGAQYGTDRTVMLKAAMEALDGCDVDWTRHRREDAVAEVAFGLTNWWEAPIPDGQPGAGGSLRDRLLDWRPVAVERRFRYYGDTSPRGNSGSPDCIYQDETGRLLVVDHKSARNFNRYGHDGAQVRPQAAVYSRAAILAPNLPGRRADGWPRVEFQIARVEQGSTGRFQGVRVVQVQPDDGDMAWLDERMREGDRVVAAGQFTKNPAWFLCSAEWCPFHVGAGGPCNPDGPIELPVDVSDQPQPYR